jgi:hypothetical protein
LFLLFLIFLLLFFYFAQLEQIRILTNHILEKQVINYFFLFRGNKNTTNYSDLVGIKKLRWWIWCSEDVYGSNDCTSGAKNRMCTSANNRMRTSGSGREHAMF